MTRTALLSLAWGIPLGLLSILTGEALDRLVDRLIGEDW